MMLLDMDGTGFDREVDREEARDAADRVLTSASFADASRLRAFLAHILDEHFAGRAERLNAPAIAIDVFGRDPSADTNSEAVVRVQAGRLRRKLARYYETSGQDDPVRVTIPKGGYAPAFEKRSLIDRLIDRPADQPGDVPPEPDDLTHVADVESADPEAVALFREAWNLRFPGVDAERLLSARRAFQRVIDIDPGFAGGYAGLSLTYSQMVAYARSAAPEDDLAMAADLSAKAISLGPMSAPALIAHAYTLLLKRRCEEAIVAVRRATEIDSDDAYSWAIHGMVLHFCGLHGEAIEAVRHALRLDPSEPRTPYLNILGAALYHDGDVGVAIEAFEQNRLRGGPVAPSIFGYLAAAYAAAGDLETARQNADKLAADKTGFSMEKWLSRSFCNRDPVDRFLADFAKIGPGDSSL